MDVVSQDVQPFVMHDRRVENATRLLNLIDTGEASYFDELDAAWTVRSIANSVKGGTSPMPASERVSMAVREFLS